MALERLLGSSPNRRSALAASLNIFWYSQGKLREGISWLERATRGGSGRAGRAAGDGPVLRSLARRARHRRLAGRGRRSSTSGSTRSRDADEPPLVLGMLLCLRGECDVFNDEPSPPSLAPSRLDIAARYPGSWGQGFCAWNVGNARRALGDEDGALAMFMEDDRAHRGPRLRDADMVACNDVGQTWEERGDARRGPRVLGACAARRAPTRTCGALRIGHVHGTMPTALLAVARVAEQQGDLATTSKLLREGLPLAEEMREVETAQLMAELLRKTTRVEPDQRAILQPQDGIWRIEFNGTNVHVPDLKGLWHLREFVARPHRARSRALADRGVERDPLPSADTGPCSTAGAQAVPTPSRRARRRAGRRGDPRRHRASRRSGPPSATR